MADALQNAAAGRGSPTSAVCRTQALGRDIDRLWLVKTSCSASFVAMMKTADPRQRDHDAAAARLHRPRGGRVLVE